MRIFYPRKKKEIKRNISGLTEKRRFFAFSLGEIFKGYHVGNITFSDTLIMIFQINIKQFISDKKYRCCPTVDFLDQNYKSLLHCTVAKCYQQHKVEIKFVQNSFISRRTVQKTEIIYMFFTSI